MRLVRWQSLGLLLATHTEYGECLAGLTKDVEAHNGDHAQQRNSKQKPIGVRKMSDDEGEMFFPYEYWQFDPFASRGTSPVDQTEIGNCSYEVLNPPLAPHVEQNPGSKLSRMAYHLFKRDFQCPTGTFSCSSIGQSNSCCSTGETCITVQDTGLGPVGCCPQGQTCGGAVASCNTAEGYSSCPGTPNGGCCIPGYSCQGVGCVYTDTTISTFTTTLVIISPSAEPTTVTQTLTISPSSSETITASPVPPFRPTSDSSTVTTTSTTTAALTSTTDDACPTNFYRCSAYYVGGCCRVGRDCSSTSCPPAASSTVATDSYATVVAASSTNSGNCANGWQTCPASVGGGCCPGGYACGSVTCSATAAGQSNVGKTSDAMAAVCLDNQPFWLVIASVGLWFVP
ncbi:hypothetical protein ANO11243_008430 [Dothideomycetidae sp. 11243]|nr:hypothetical protein ANO11243_008430 [fungal sp. No.11243]